MGRMKELYTQILECDTCYGKGWLYYGNEEMYDVEACQCNPLGTITINKCLCSTNERENLNV